MPGLLEFDGDCLIVLSKSLLAVKPDEGCALLIGDEQKSKQDPTRNIWKVQLIWPCCNVWKEGIFDISEHEKVPERPKSKNATRQNRFAIDPREQIHAQRWSRQRNLKVLGAAHSHPGNEAIPSSIDRAYCFTPGLMVIVNGSGNIRGWSTGNTKNISPIELIILNRE